MLPALLVALVAGAIVRRYAPRWGLLDQPGHRKVHSTPTPLGGGLAIWLGVVIPFAVGQVLLWVLPYTDDGPTSFWNQVPGLTLVRPHLAGLAAQAPQLWFLLACGTALVVLGLWDDLRGLDWRLRIVVQIAVATAVVLYGWKITFYVDIPWLTGAVTVIWIVALINSFNMLDNMDGLSGGVAAIAGTLLAAVLLIVPDPQTHHPQLFVAGLLLVLVGAVLGFLFHNRPPARLFMGDAGSYFLGFVLAVATILATFTGGVLPRHAIFAPLCILAVPLYDMLTVIAIRLKQGRSPFVGDKSHFSHRLVELGMTKGQAVLTIYLTTATCGLGALLLHRLDGVGASIVLLIVACVLLLVWVLERSGRGGSRS